MRLAHLQPATELPCVPITHAAILNPSEASLCCTRKLFYNGAQPSTITLQIITERCAIYITCMCM